LEQRELEDRGAAWRVEVVEEGGRDLLIEGVNGSLVISGKEGSWPGSSCVLNSMDLTKTT